MSEKKATKIVFVQIIERPARKVLLKRGIKATEYFGYCEEVGCDVWPMLLKKQFMNPLECGYQKT